MRSLSQLFRSRSARLVVGLAIAVAIPTSALIYVQVRAIRDLEQTSIVVLETLGTQAAEAFAQVLATEFGKPSVEMERVDHGAVEQVDLARVVTTLLPGGTKVPLVDSFYVCSMRGPAAGDLFELAYRGRDAASASFTPARAEALPLVTLARGFADAHRQWGTALVSFGQRSQAVVMHLMFDSRARDHLVAFIAFRIDLDRFAKEDLARLLGPIVSAANRRTALASLVVAVVDHEGREVYRSEPGPPLAVVEERVLPLAFSFPGQEPVGQPCEGCLPPWSLRIGYAEGSVAAAARGSTTGYRTLLLVLGAVLALGVLLAARLSLKEVQLAEAKSHFVASVSHDLKTPLALIQLFAETLDLGRVRSVERAREYYAIINREAKKLAALIDNILDFSRVESGLRMYRLQPVDLGQIVQRVARGFAPRLEHEGFDLRVHLTPALPPVLADEEAVELAVGNLLSNAMKYSGTSHRIDVRVDPCPEGVSVAVRDHGIGIPRRHQRRIFRKFYRVESTEPDAPRGCGLGLAIVDHVMRAHHGHVRVDSTPGLGSTFTLVFPATTEKRRDEAYPDHRRRTPDAAGVA